MKARDVFKQYLPIYSFWGVPQLSKRSKYSKIEAEMGKTVVSIF